MIASGHGIIRADYTHVVTFGPNDLSQAAEAMQRWALGGTGYEDPIPFDALFTTASGELQPTLAFVETVSNFPLDPQQYIDNCEKRRPYPPLAMRHRHPSALFPARYEF